MQEMTEDFWEQWTQGCGCSAQFWSSRGFENRTKFCAMILATTPKPSERFQDRDFLKRENTRKEQRNNTWSDWTLLRLHVPDSYPAVLYIVFGCFLAAKTTAGVQMLRPKQLVCNGRSPVGAMVLRLYTWARAPHGAGPSLAKAYHPWWFSGPMVVEGMVSGNSWYLSSNGGSGRPPNDSHCAGKQLFETEHCDFPRLGWGGMKIIEGFDPLAILA